MALAYALLLEPLVPGRAWMKGALYAVLVWLLNTLVLLPGIGEGIAGRRTLPLAGMTYYAMAHTVFFVLTALLYARLRRWRCMKPMAPRPTNIRA